MYKATNIDTDKALQAIDQARICQERESNVRAVKERAYIEGINKGLDIAESLFECSNYEKTAQEATYTDGVNETLYELGKELDVPTQDIRDNISSVDEACALFADRIRKKMTGTTDKKDVEKPLTNADRIRSMTDEELSDFLCSVEIFDNGSAKTIIEGGVAICSVTKMEEWLRAESEEKHGE